MRPTPLLLLLLAAGCIPPLFPSKTGWHFPERAAPTYEAMAIYRELPEAGDPAVAFTFTELERVDTTLIGRPFVHYVLRGRFANASPDTFFVTSWGVPVPFMQAYYRAPATGPAWKEGFEPFCGYGLRPVPVAPGTSHPFSAILEDAQPGTEVRLHFPFHFAGADSVREALSPVYHVPGMPAATPPDR